MKKKSTRTTAPRVLHEGQYLGLMKTEQWEFVTRTNAKAVTCIVPQTSAGHFVLVEQFRPALNTQVIEWPAGLVGDEAGMELEDLLTSAKRELEEETGLTSQFWSTAGCYASSAGLTDETVHFFLARYCQKTGKGGGVGNENIVTHHVPAENLTHWLLDRVGHGVLLDAKVATGCWLWNQLSGQ